MRFNASIMYRNREIAKDTLAEARRQIRYRISHIRELSREVDDRDDKGLSADRQVMLLQDAVADLNDRLRSYKRVRSLFGVWDARVRLFDQFIYDYNAIADRHNAGGAR